VLERVARPVTPEPAETYRQAGVHWWGLGAYERDPIEGSGTRYKVLYRIAAGDIVINKIWARHGAVAVVPPALDGALVSGEFPTFTCRGEALLPAWIKWLSRTPWFWNACDEKARGTSGKDRITPERFLDITVPLPSVELQERWDTLLVGASTLLERVGERERAALGACERLVTAEELSLWPESSLRSAPPLAEVTRYLARGRQSSQGPSDHVLIKTQHVQMGRYLPSSLTLDAETARRVAPDALVEPGDVLIACSAAGCLGRVAVFDQPGVRASTDTHIAIARADSTKVLAEYLYAYLRGAQGQMQLRSRERGDWTREKVGFRLTELNLRDLQQVPVPVPPRAEQTQIVRRISLVRARVSRVMRLQTDRARSRESLLPALIATALGEMAHPNPALADHEPS